MLPLLVSASNIASASLYWSSLASSMGSVLWDQSVSNHYVRSSWSDALDGYAYNCNGMVIGFSSNTILCQSTTSGETFTCGDYGYKQDTHRLSGNTSSGPFVATELELHDDILVSFVAEQVTCHIVSLDFYTYSQVDYMGFQCPSQNQVPNVSHQLNHFSFGQSGDVALRSQVNIHATADTADTDGQGGNVHNVISDSYGVYNLNTETGVVEMYFGPQHGRPTTRLSGTIKQDPTSLVELNVKEYKPSGPCVHDGISPMQNLKELNPIITETNESTFATSGAASLFVTWTLPLLATMGIGVTLMVVQLVH